MPSANPSLAVVTDEQRQSPPASEGLIAPAAVTRRQEQRDRERVGAGRPGRRTDVEEQQIFDVVTALMDKATSTAEIAREAGCDPKTAAGIIRRARMTLAARAEFYAEAHAVATAHAAADGDAKPAQWALERISEEGERVVDAPEQSGPKGPTGPTFNFGFRIGGIASSPVSALPAVEGVVLDKTEKA